jgi:RNA polymerase sigma-70 factor (ECF subfamily)
MLPSVRSELPALVPRLRRYAYALCQSSALADDLVQSACERALAQSSLWTPGTRLDAWLFRIIRNCWIDGVRRARVQAEVESTEMGDGVVDGERHAIGRVEFGQIAERIEALPWEQREVLLLVCVDDLSYREAAEILNVPIGTVMSRLARARKRLVEECGHTSGDAADEASDGRRRG